MGSNEVLQFKLGDLVLVRYSSFPYWPAAVSPTHQRRYKGKHFITLRTRGGDLVPCFWCTFANDDSGGWVRADRMIVFHPALLDKIRVPKENEWYTNQKQAIKSAIKSFQDKYKGEKKQIPNLTPDLERGPLNGKWDAMDDDDIITDDETYPNFADCKDRMDQQKEGKDEKDGASPWHSGRPSKGGKTILCQPQRRRESRKATKRSSLPGEETHPKKRAKTSSTPEKGMLRSDDKDPEEARRKVPHKDVQEEIIDRSSRKRRRHSYPEPCEPFNKVRKTEDELASANERIANLKKTLKRTERKLSELTGGGVGLACVIPPFPPQLQAPSPESQNPRSIPVYSVMFNTMMNTLSSEYEAFESAATAADDARTELENTMETIKKLYHEASLKVSNAEEKATIMERDVVCKLREILEVDVQVQDLRKRRAGKEIRAMLKDCNKLPVIRDFCSAVNQSWKKQVMAYMKEVEDRKSEFESETPTENTKTVWRIERKATKDGEVKGEDKIEKEKKKTPPLNATEKDMGLNDKAGKSEKAEKLAEEPSNIVDGKKLEDIRREEKPTALGISRQHPYEAGLEI